MSNIKSIIITQITNFINELNEIYPDNKEITVFRERFNLLKNVNSQLILDYFIKYIYKYKKNILNENENFFLDGGGQEKIHESNLNMRDNIRTLWINNMTEDNKKIVWKYFKTFILLIDKYLLEKSK